MPNQPSTPNKEANTSESAEQKAQISCPLNKLQPEQCGIIDRIELDSEQADELMRLGLTPGRRVMLLKGGTRCLVATAGARVALDRRLAAGIFIIRENKAS